MPKIRRKGERGGEVTIGSPPKPEAVAKPKKASPKRRAKKEAPVADISGDVTTIEKPKRRKASR